MQEITNGYMNVAATVEKTIVEKLGHNRPSSSATQYPERENNQAPGKMRGKAATFARSILAKVPSTNPARPIRPESP